MSRHPLTLSQCAGCASYLRSGEPCILCPGPTRRIRLHRVRAAARALVESAGARRW